MKQTLKVYGYRKCDTCRKAYAFLTKQGLAFAEVDITEQAPTLAELKSMLAAQDGALKSLFNTSGQAYRELGGAAKLATLGEAEALRLLAANGRLVKRPFLLIGGKGATVGLKVDVWKRLLD